jgi:hypothetical protein
MGDSGDSLVIPAAEFAVKDAMFARLVDWPSTNRESIALEWALRSNIDCQVMTRFSSR